MKDSLVRKVKEVAGVVCEGLKRQDKAAELHPALRTSTLEVSSLSHMSP